MVRRRFLLTVSLSPHAIERWSQHVGPISKGRLARRIRGHIHEALKSGLRMDPTGAGHVEIIRGELWAVIEADRLGGWGVRTFHKGEHEGFQEYWSGYIEERKQAYPD